MGKKILVLNGSPIRNGNTAALATWFAQGARAKGATVETIAAAFLKYKSNGCTSCRKCQKIKEFACVINDEASPVLLKMAKADVIVFATPLYFYGPSAQLKLIIDRMFSLYKWDNAAGTFVSPMKGKTMVLLLSAYEDAGLSVVEKSFSLIAGYSEMKFKSLLVPNARESGEIARLKGVREKTIDLGKKTAVSIAMLLACLSLFCPHSFAGGAGPTGWWTDSEGHNHYGSPPSESSGGSSSGSSYSADYAAASMATQFVTSFISNMQAQMQQNAQNSVAMNNQAVVYHNQGDYDSAISYYEEALRLNPYDRTIADNLAKARAARADKLAKEAIANFDKAAAAKYLREYLSYQDDPEARAKLAEIEKDLDFDRQLRERDDRLKEAKTRVDQAVSDLAGKLGVTPAVNAGQDASGLEFIGGTSTVDLSGINPGKPMVINPAAMKEAEKGVHYRQIPEPKGVVPEWDPYSVSTKADIILDAVKEGNGSWNNSAAYLEKYLQKYNAHNMQVREALSYVEGVRDGQIECEGVPKKGLFDAEESDSAALLEAVAGDKMGKPQPRPDIFGWKSDRQKLILEAAKKTDNNWAATVKYLDNKIKKDPEDYTALQARSYLEGLRAYEEFTRDHPQKK
jgi:multimeric flavodoxin WrbA/tetratricopeptide (TPR) repeat protein